MKYTQVWICETKLEEKKTAEGSSYMYEGKKTWERLGEKRKQNTPEILPSETSPTHVDTAQNVKVGTVIAEGNYLT